jgi:hypothetical protein
MTIEEHRSEELMGEKVIVLMIANVHVMYMCMHMYTCMDMCMNICMYMYISINMCLYMYMCECMYVYV